MKKKYGSQDNLIKPAIKTSYKIGGKTFGTQKDASEHFGVNKNTVWWWIKNKKVIDGFATTTIKKVVV